MKKAYLIYFLITLLGLIILKVWLYNRLILYVHPSIVWFVVAATAALIAVGFVWIIRLPDHIHISRARLIALAIIVLAFAALPNVPLSPRMAKLRQNDAAVPQLRQGAIAGRGASSTFNVLEWWAAWESDPTHSKYIGSTSKVIGFVLKEDGRYYVARFVLTCCAVDAQPVGIEFDPLQQNPPEQEWVEVQGTMADKEGKPFIKTTTITPISEPESPYVY